MKRMLVGRSSCFADDYLPLVRRGMGRQEGLLVLDWRNKGMRFGNN
jgi:hypothetical protein